MNEYFRNKRTGVIYRMWHKSETEIVVFERFTKHYFDGLWEYETEEKQIGVFDNKDEAFKKML